MMTCARVTASHHVFPDIGESNNRFAALIQQHGSGAKIAGGQRPERLRMALNVPYETRERGIIRCYKPQSEFREIVIHARKHIV